MQKHVVNPTMVEFLLKRGVNAHELCGSFSLWHTILRLLGGFARDFAPTDESDYNLRQWVLTLQVLLN